MKRCTAPALVLALTIAGIPGAHAGTLPPSTPPSPAADASTTRSFSELDRNKDDVLTQDEVPADHELATVFARYDRDGDLSINRSEFDLYMNDDGDAVVSTDDDELDDDEDDDR